MNERSTGTGSIESSVMMESGGKEHGGTVMNEYVAFPKNPQYILKKHHHYFTVPGALACSRLFFWFYRLYDKLETPDRFKAERAVSSYTNRNPKVSETHSSEYEAESPRPRQC